MSDKKRKDLENKLKKVLGFMVLEIFSNEEALEQLKFYFCKRDKRITRKSFFKNYVWAVWVAGKSFDAASAFLERAEDLGFSWDYEKFGSWSEKKFNKFVYSLHGDKNRAFKMWKSIYDMAKRLKSYENEAAFRKDFFGGKASASALSHEDVKRLIDMHLEFVGEASINFILRNMGGEFIKDDVWIKAFCEFFGIKDMEELKSALTNIGIKHGLFDIVVWSYGSYILRDTKKLSAQLRKVCS